MSHRNPNPPVGTGDTSPWPYETMPEEAATEGPWKMGMSGGGSMVIWPADEPFPESLHLIEAFWGDLEQLERFHTMFCMRGYETDLLHKHQGNAVWLFNWISGTVAQVRIAGQIAKLMFDGDTDAAWKLGHSFENRLRTAEFAAAGS